MIVDVTELVDSTKLNAFHIRVVGLCALLIFFDGFDLQAISYAAPALSKALGFDRATLGPVFSAGFLGLTLGALVFGLLGDRIGRKPVFILCGVVFGLASYGTATSTSVNALLIWRLIAGFGLGGATPMSITIATDYCPKRMRATLTMIMYCGFTLGGVFGGWVAARLIGQYGWPTLFYVGGTLPIVLAPVLAVLLPETVEYMVLNNVNPDRIARVLRKLKPGFTAPAGTRYILSHGGESGFQVAHLFMHGRAKVTLLLWSVFFTSLISLFAFTTWLPTLLSGLSISPDGIVGITFAVQGGGLLGALILARIVMTVRPFLMIAIGYLIAAAFLVVFSQMPNVYWLLWGTALLTGIALVGTQNLLNAMCAQVYPPAMRSTGVGWAIGVGRIGSIIGPSLVSLLVVFQFQPSQLFLCAALPPLVAGFLAFALLAALGANGRTAAAVEAAE